MIHKKYSKQIKELIRIQEQNLIELSRLFLIYYKLPIKKYSDIKFSNKIQQKLTMMFWCHNCQRAVHSVQSIKCEFCSCEAIEEITPENCPQNFQPYIPQNNVYSSQQSTQNIPQANPRPRQFARDPFGMDLFGGFPGMNLMSSIFSNGGNEEPPMLVRYTISRPVFSILIIDTEEDQKTPVEAQKLSQLQKVQCLKEECAICQQKDGSGLKLPCNHEFHENCIKPWFEQTNTCPCCRTSL